MLTSQHSYRSYYNTMVRDTTELTNQLEEFVTWKLRGQKISFKSTEVAIVSEAPIAVPVRRAVAF